MSEMESQGNDASADYLRVAQKLISGTDKQKFEPFRRVNYQERLDHDRLQFPEVLVPLHGHPAYATLSDEARWQLGLDEAINFFSFNIHGEQALVAELEPRIYRDKRAGEDPLSSRYMQRFIHEENSHTYMLAEYCIRYGGGVNRDRNFAVQAPKLSPAGSDALFYGRTYTLEVYLGHVNKIAFDDPQLDRTAIDIHRFHHSDEARHKAWDKAMVEENTRRLIAAGATDELATVRGMLDAYADYVVTASVDPQPLRRAGLENVSRIREEILRSPERLALHAQWRGVVTRFLDKIGLVATAS
jgi:hypothetical protein